MTNYTPVLNNITSSNSTIDSVIFWINEGTEHWIAYGILILIFAVALVYLMTRQEKIPLETALVTGLTITWLVSALMVVWVVSGLHFLEPIISIGILILLVAAIVFRVYINN